MPTRSTGGPAAANANAGPELRRTATRRRRVTSVPHVAAETIVHHFPLRHSHFVRISGVPFNITKYEMARLTTFLSHLVAVKEEQTDVSATLPTQDSV